MASPNSTFTELVSTTFRKHRKDIKDNISHNNALLARMMKGDRSRTEDGGLSIVEPLEYAENSTYQRYSGLDFLNVGLSDVISSAEFQWRQIAMNVVATGRELRINKGDSRILNLAKTRIKNAIRTFKNNFSLDVYSDGTLSNQINGLQALVADAGTGTVGGIDSGTWMFWRNQAQLASAPIQGGGAIVMSPSTIETQMLNLWLSVVRGDDKPDLWIMDNNYFGFYEASQLSIKRYTEAKEADGGFMSLKYKGADVIYDGGSGIPSNHAYALNTNYISLVTHPDADMTVMPEMTPINQDGVVTPVLWMGNLTCSNRARQGVMKA